MSRINLCLAVIVWLLVNFLPSDSAMSPLAQGQVVAGQPMVRNGSSLTTDPQGAIVDAYVANGNTGDVCAGITAAWSVVTAVGLKSATIDARGYTGVETCSSTSNSGGPIPSTVTGRVLLGNVTLTIQGTWKIPSGVELIGLGAMNTTLIAGTGVTTVIEMGNGTSQFGVKIRALTVDCNGNTSCIGIDNVIAEEGSMVEDVNINNAATGLNLVVGDTGTNKAENSGPYRNIMIQFPSTTCCSGAVGVSVSGSDAGKLIRGLENITFAACGTAAANGVGMKIVGASTRIANSTISCADGTSTSSGGIQIGAGSSLSPTHNVMIEDVYFFATSSNPTVNGVYADQYSSDIFVSGIGASSNVTNLLNDQVQINSQTRQIGGPFLGFYIRGEINSPLGKPPALATSAPSVAGSGTNLKWSAPDRTQSGQNGVCTPTSGTCTD